ncbi:outer membrane beta-barrel protein [Pedobacter caeni]|uniref:Outer membrane protein beta-barrel domain-containing protein n=1 Tax=Pedobacter caeni TaxID=288992 RepID=A0A1M5EFU8_9SPHI|nr:outer membrane beta-barrel protein [Pedobacter caeni]SHF78056.1 Outer membrane protein beta-barrel domain-containing protein [Pedobacter caeni]
MKQFLVGLFLAIPMMSIAQSNFHKGYLITNANDTLKGYIDYKEGSSNSDSFIFKSDLSAKPQSYNLTNCAAYGIDGLVAYQRFLVNISLGSEDLGKLSDVIDRSSRRDTVFLEVLQVGPKVSLYIYRDRIKKRYYILDRDDQEPSELLRHLYNNPNNPGSAITNVEYARQLIPVLKKYDQWTETSEYKLRGLGYNSAELLKIVARINNQQVEKSGTPKLRFFVGAGINLSDTRFKGKNKLASKTATSKTSVDPMISGGVDFFANPSIRRLLFRIELTLASGKSEVTSEDAGSSFDLIALTINPQIIYNFYNAENFKFFMGAGPEMTYSKYSNQKAYLLVRNVIPEGRREEVKLDLRSFYATFQATAGVVLNKRLELSIGYSLPSSLTNYAYYGLERTKFRAGINYLFGKR